MPNGIPIKHLKTIAELSSAYQVEPVIGIKVHCYRNEWSCENLETDGKDCGLTL